MIGKFKDEANGDPIIEFVGLRPKMYSFQTMKNTTTGATICEKQRCKGIQRCAQKKLKHSDYLDQLLRPAENVLVNRRIGSKLHQLYTWESKKRGLCSFDDKRFLLEDGVHSYAFGHHAITARVHDDIAPEGTALVITTDTDAPDEMANDDELVDLTGLDRLPPSDNDSLGAQVSDLPTSAPTSTTSSSNAIPPAKRPREQASEQPTLGRKPTTGPAKSPRYLPPGPDDIPFVTKSPSRNAPRYLPPTPEQVTAAGNTRTSLSRMPHYLPPTPEQAAAAKPRTSSSRMPVYLPSNKK